MKIRSLIVLSVFLMSCTGPNQTPTDANTKVYPPQNRQPSSTVIIDDGSLAGTYLGEGQFSKRTVGMKRPAVRLYLDRVEGEVDSYYGVVFEYDKMLAMTLPYLSSQKAPVLNKVFGYLDKIGTRISAFKVVPGAKPGSYHMHNLEVHDGQIVPAARHTLVLNLSPTKGIHKLSGATIAGLKDGNIVFPTGQDKKGFFGSIGDLVTVSELELAATTYKLGKLKSTWRGNWADLQGSYLSEYGRVTDGVLELYQQNGQYKAKFIKTNTTQAKHFTNPKSAAIEGDYFISEPIPKMYLLVPTQRARTASDREMVGRIGLMLDIFDASAPEAGGHMVTELAYTNPHDPEDFMMYYEHPEHKANVGVEPAKNATGGGR